MKRYFQEELAEIHSRLLMMGELAIEAVRKSVQSLIEDDGALAASVIASDDDIDILEKEIDSECVRYITLRAPVASDVRLITVAMKTCHELERIGDEANSIAKRSRKLIALPPESLVGIPRMADLTINLLKESMDCFIQEDAKTAFDLPKKDKEIDDIHRENFFKLTEAISKNPDDSALYVDLIFVSKSLERIADHATNIAEEVVFLLKGQDVRHSDEVKRSGMA